MRDTREALIPLYSSCLGSCQDDSHYTATQWRCSLWIPTHDRPQLHIGRSELPWVSREVFTVSPNL